MVQALTAHALRATELNRITGHPPLPLLCAFLTRIFPLSQAFAIGGDEQSLNPEAKRVMMEIMGKVTNDNAIDLHYS